MIIHNTKKFKTTVVSIRFKEEVLKENVGLRALLPNLMTVSTKTYKTKKALSEALEELYGAALRSKVSKVGNLSILEITLQIVNPSITGIKAFEEGLKLLHEAVYGHVNLPKKEFELQKQLVIQTIKAFENDKTNYALSNLLEHMFKEENYGIRISGKVDDVSQVSYEALNKYYKQVIRKNDVDVILSGDITDEIESLVKKYFKPKNEFNLSPIDYESKEVTEVQSFEDFDSISQAKVNIGYRFPVRFSDPDYHAAFLFNVALGGGVHSRLFLNVREKHSLCYYVASRYDAYKGFSFIYSGIDKSRVELALSEIEYQINDLKKNKLTEEELNLSKISTINYLKEVEDNQGSSIGVIYGQALRNEVKSLEERINEILSVTPEDVLKVSAKFKEDTLYILSPEVEK